MSIDISSVEEAVRYAKKDLADRLGPKIGTITVLKAGEATWPDASLGMPEAGTMYAQMLTEGFLIVLEAFGKTYEYHFGNGIMKTK